MTKGREVPPRETVEQAHQRYMHHLHRMQTGISYLQQFDPSSGSPKHLRVGINSGKVEHGALVKLLVEKGIITDAEYMTAMADAVQEEADRYEQELSEKYGANIKLGSMY